jgi:predicted secreted hydrolase
MCLFLASAYCPHFHLRLRGFASLFLSAVIFFGADWKKAESDFPWSFPRDHWAHRAYRTEWWYFTGHLEAEDEPGRIFGYQFTFFRIGLLDERPDLDSDWATQGLIMGHAAITDVAARRHHFSEVLYREVPLLGEFRSFPDNPVAGSRGPAGTDHSWSLVWNGRAFDFEMRDAWQGLALALRTHPEKPLVFQGPNGFSKKGGGGASLYYSFTRLETEGTLEVDGRVWKVRGTSWMDREFSSSQLGVDQVGWDWFSLQLDDGRDVMLYVLRREDGSTDFRNGTLVLPDGTPRYLASDDWTMETVTTWTSPQTEAVYPSQWVLEMPGEDLGLNITPLVENQENRSRLPGGVYYWEGAVVVKDGEGSVVGRGYVELTGYGENNKPPV